MVERNGVVFDSNGTLTVVLLVAFGYCYTSGTADFVFTGRSTSASVNTTTPEVD